MLYIIITLSRPNCWISHQFSIIIRKSFEDLLQLAYENNRVPKYRIFPIFILNSNLFHYENDAIHDYYDYYDRDECDDDAHSQLYEHAQANYHHDYDLNVHDDGDGGDANDHGHDDGGHDHDDGDGLYSIKGFIKFSLMKNPLKIETMIEK